MTRNSVVNTIAMRYLSIPLQFLVVVLISRKTDLEVQGIYFAIFGIVTTTRYLAGAGIPLGLVRDVPAAIGAGETHRVWPLVVAANWGCILLSMVFVATSIGIAMLFGVDATTALLAGIWWCGYAAIYYCAQVLVALSDRKAGSFFYFTAPPVAQLGTLAPYLFFASQPSLTGLLLATIAGAAPLALWAVWGTYRALHRGGWPRGPAERSAILSMIGFGFMNTLTSFAISAIYWVPTWMAGLVLGPAAAGVMGLTSRLYNVVLAPLGAIRFIARPQIVAAAAQSRWRSIERNARLICTLTAAAALLSLGAHLAVGNMLIEAIFGPQFAPAYLVLAVLLLGATAEGMGGVVEEILKMTGAVRFVVVLLGCCIAGEIILAWALAKQFGMVGTAAAQTVCLIIIYLVETGYLRSTRGITILPFLTPGRALRAYRTRYELGT